MKHWKINMIVAACEDMGIGLNGKLPWRLRGELGHFSKLTKTTQDPSKYNTVIMGRRTWESIPSRFRPLPDRKNIILSSTLSQADVPEDVIVKDSLEAVLKLLESSPFSENCETVWIIGGSSLYKSVISAGLCHRIYLTKINARFACDTFLDPVDETQFQVVTDPSVSSDLQEEEGITYMFLVYQKSGL